MAQPFSFNTKLVLTILAVAMLQGPQVGFSLNRPTDVLEYYANSNYILVLSGSGLSKWDSGGAAIWSTSIDGQILGMVVLPNEMVTVNVTEMRFPSDYAYLKIVIGFSGQVVSIAQGEMALSHSLYSNRQIVSINPIGSTIVSNSIDNSELWRVDVPAVLWGMELVKGKNCELVFASALEILHCFDSSGKEKWSLDLNKSFLEKPIELVGAYRPATIDSNGNIFICSQLAGLSYVNKHGDLIWQKKPLGGSVTFSRVILLPNGNLIVRTWLRENNGGDKSYIVAYSPSGEELWKYPFEGIMADRVMESGHIVFAEDNAVIILNSSGEFIKSIPTDQNKIYPIVVGNRVFIVDELSNGRFLKLD